MQTAFQALPHWSEIVVLFIPAASATFAAAALFLNLYQVRRTNAQHRAALVAASLKGFMGNDKIQCTFYEIEYSLFKYNPSFHKSEAERKLDTLLQHFAVLALSWKIGLLRTEEIRPVQYYILRIMNNGEVEKYLKFLEEEWSPRAGAGPHPFETLRELSNELAIMARPA